MIETWWLEIKAFAAHLWKLRKCIIRHDFKKRSYENTRVCNNCETVKYL